MAIIHTLSLEDNEVLFKKKIKQVAEPNYNRIGNGTVNKHKITSIDLIDVVIEASGSGKWLIKKIKDGIGWDNSYDPVVKITPANNPEKQHLVRGFAELSAKDLVRRIKRSHYMINPNALIPAKYEEALAIWEAAAPVPTVPPTP